MWVSRLVRWGMSEVRLSDRARRLLLAFDLFEAGVDMHRQTLRRRYPNADEAEIERRLDAWLLERPGAEHGDVAGAVRVRSHR